jgi:hypothetical protein
MGITRRALRAIRLAVDLSVAEALQAKRALKGRPTRTSLACAKRWSRNEELAVNQPTQKLAGVAGLFGPLGLTPTGPPSGRYPARRYAILESIRAE